VDGEREENGDSLSLLDLVNLGAVLSRPSKAEVLTDLWKEKDAKGRWMVSKRKVRSSRTNEQDNKERTARLEQASLTMLLTTASWKVETPLAAAKGGSTGRGTSETSEELDGRE
jgi:hypothetical protein